MIKQLHAKQFERSETIITKLQPTQDRLMNVAWKITGIDAHDRLPA